MNGGRGNRLAGLQLAPVVEVSRHLATHHYGGPVPHGSSAPLRPARVSRDRVDDREMDSRAAPRAFCYKDISRSRPPSKPCMEPTCTSILVAPPPISNPALGSAGEMERPGDGKACRWPRGGRAHAPSGRPATGDRGRPASACEIGCRESRSGRSGGTRWGGRGLDGAVNSSASSLMGFRRS